MNPKRPPVLVFEEPAIKEAVVLDSAAVEAIEAAFAHLAAGGVQMPPIMQILIPDYGGQTCIKGAWIPGLEYFAVKMSSIYPRPHGANVAESNGMFALLESATGRMRACLLDNGYLTQLRTAAAGAVATQYLAPLAVDTVGVIGAGKQALWQINAAYLVRKFKRVVIWSRSAQRATELASRVQSLLPVTASVANAVQQVIGPAQLVITTTPSREPLLDDADLHSSLHITAVGSDAKGKRELSDRLLRAIDLYVADDVDQCRAYGELQTISEHEVRRIDTLGDIVAGKARRREREDQTTVSDLTGLGVQDTAVAIEAFRRLMADKLTSRSPLPNAL